MVSNPTHKVVITLTSSENKPDVNIKVQWDPLMGDDDISKAGYTPTAYTVAESLLFAIEDLVNKASLLEVEEGDLDSERTIN